MRRRHPQGGLGNGDLRHGTLSGAAASTSKWGLRRGMSRKIALYVSTVLLATAVFLMSYLLFEALRFVNPCQVAYEAKLQLAKSPKRISEPFPKIIHQQWVDSNIPEGTFSEYNAQWKKLFPEPEYKHILWTDASGRKLIEEQFPWFLEAYDSYPMNIQRADAMRYFILYLYGGVYADLDYEPFVNFWDVLPPDRVSLIESPYRFNEWVQNSLMASPPRDPFWNVTFELLYERRKVRRVLASTGPSLMDAAMLAAGKGAVHVLPCQNFQRIPLGEAGRNTPFTARLSRTLAARTPLVKTCGDWSRRNDCQFGLHHNAVSYLASYNTNINMLFSNI